jgi:hypothetical protein
VRTARARHVAHIAVSGGNQIERILGMRFKTISKGRKKGQAVKEYCVKWEG